MDEELLDLLAAIRDVLRGVDDPRAAAARAAAEQAVDASDPEGALADLRYFIDEREGIQHEHEAATLGGEAMREGDQQ
jgi:hypothetical protein